MKKITSLSNNCFSIHKKITVIISCLFVLLGHSLKAQSISGAASACVNGTTVYSCTPTGYTWSSGNAAIATIDSVSGTLTGVSAGIVTITYNKPGSPKTLTVTVNPQPAVYAGVSSSICNGSSTTVSCSTSSMGNALHFSGANGNYVTIPNSANLKLQTSNFTVSAWIYTSSTAQQNILFHGYGCSTWANWYLGIGGPEPESNNNPGKIVFGFRTSNGNGGPVVAAPTTVPTNTWIQVTATYDGSNLKLYLNGSLVSTAAATGLPWNSGENLFIGQDPGCGGRNPYNGSIDEFKVWNVTRTAVSIAADYNQRIAAATTGVIGAWSFDEASGSTIVDSSAGSDNGTVTGTISRIAPTTAPLAGGSAASSFSWAPSTGLSATTGTTITANPTATTSYTVTGTSAAGCVNTAVQTITVNAVPVVSAGSNVSICSGTSTILTASGAATYSWSPATGLSASTGAVVTASPTSTKTYTVTGIAAGGCSNTATVTVSVNPAVLPTITAAGIAICTGANGTLSASGATNYSWSPATGLSSTTGSTVTASPSATTTYTITGTNGSGCSNTASVTVTVNALPVISAGSGSSICNGSSASITATGGTTYSWAPATGLSATSGASVTAGPAITTSYTVTGINGAGCSSQATTTITVNAIPAISATAAGAYCTGSSTSLSATGGVTYHWAPATGLSATTGSAVTASAATATQYTVTGTSSSGCSNTAAVSVTVNPSPVMTSAGNGGAICAGSTLTLNSAATGGTGVIAYSWAGPNAFSSAAQNPSIASATTLASGVYTITATDANGCVATGTSTTTATVNPMPSAGSITGAGAVCVGNTAALSNSATGGVWSANMGFATVGSSAGVVSGVAVGALTISYTVTNIYGCTAYTTKAMNVTPAPGNIYTYAGTGTNANTGDGGPAYLASMQGPRDIAVDNAGNVYFTDVTANVIRKIDVNGMISKVAGNGSTGNGGDGGPATAASLSQPLGIYVDSAANIYFSNTNSHTIRKITASTGIITTIAGVAGTSGSAGDGGPATAATFNSPMGLTMDASGNLYIADQLNYKVRKIDAGTGLISTIAGTGSYSYSGDGGPGTAARLSLTRGVTLDNSGNLYIVDGPNGVIRKLVLSTGIISTFAGTGGVLGSAGDGGPASAATFNTPSRVIFDGSNVLYVTDLSNNKVRQINLATGIVSAVVGTGGTGFSGDGGAAVLSHVYQPYGVACDKAGRMYVTDAANRRVRLASVSGSTTISVAGSTTVSSGTPVTFTAAASMTGSGVSLQWQKNGVNTGSGISSYTNASPASGDVYRCIMTITPECGVAYSDTSNSITILVSGARQADTTTAVSELNSQETIKIYPNPVHGQLTVEGTGLENGQMQISVLDQMGRVVTSRTESVDNGSITTAIDMQGYPAGMYIVMLTDNAGKSRVMKCIKN